MAYVPVSHNQPYVTDVHTHVCVAGDGNGNGGKECHAIEVQRARFAPPVSQEHARAPRRGRAPFCASSLDCNIANGANCQRFDATATATTVFNSLKDMMVKYGGIFPILGESNSNQRCDDHTPSIAKQVVDGYRASTLRSTYGSTTTFMPWNYPAGDDSIAGVAASGERFIVAASASALFPALRHDGSASSNLAAVAFQFRPDNVLTRADWLRQPTSNRRSDFILARGAIATLYARNIAPTGTLTVATSPLPRELAGVQLTIAGIPAPILGVAAVETGELVHFQVPWEVPGSEAPVPIILSRGTVSSLPIFAWTVRDWNMEILRQTDGETAWSMRNSPESLTIFATGMGPVSPPIITGLAPEDNRHRALLLPTAQWNGAAVPVEDCFLMPGLAGIYRIDIRIPAEPASVAKASLTVAVEGPSLSISDTVTVILPQD